MFHISIRTIRLICADLDSALPPCPKHTMYPGTLQPTSSLSFPPFCSILNSTFNTWLSYNFLFLINSGTHPSHCHRHFMFLSLKWLCDRLQQPLDAYYGNNYIFYSCVWVLTISPLEYDYNLFRCVVCREVIMWTEVIIHVLIKRREKDTDT